MGKPELEEDDPASTWREKVPTTDFPFESVTVTLTVKIPETVGVQLKVAVLTEEQPAGSPV